VRPDSSNADNTDRPTPARRSRAVSLFRWLYDLGRCITAGILSAVLIAGLIAGVSWRINAVAGALLANLVVVPRRLRICFARTTILSLGSRMCLPTSRLRPRPGG